MKLSIVIPTLKEEGYIEAMIKQFAPLALEHEIIVSDGGSRDRTAELARGLADLVIVFEDAKPRAARQRNDGASHALGEFLAFVDCSVRIPGDMNDFFARALAHFEENPKLVAITGPQNIFPEVETIADKFFLGCQNQIIRFQNNVLHKGAGTGKFMLMRRAAFERIGGFDETLVAGEDLDLVARLSKIGETRYTSDVAIIYPGRREHGLGWTKLLWDWTINIWWIWLFGTAYNEQWKPVR